MYDHRQGLTLHTKGCKIAMIQYFGGELLEDVGAFVLTVFGLQVSSYNSRGGI